MRFDPGYIARLIVMLAALGAVVLFGGRFAGKVARKVPA